MSAGREPAAITGAGVVASIGVGIADFTAALRAGRSGIALLPAGEAQAAGVPVAARIEGFDWKAALDRLAAVAPAAVGRAARILRNAPDSARFTTVAALEAWLAADVPAAAAEKVGLIIGGNNLHQAFIQRSAAQFLADPDRLNARYALGYFDTFQLGALSEVLGIHGPGVTVGAASASGNAALAQALLWLRAGYVDTCVVCAPVAELSAMELRGFATIGAAFAGDVAGAPAAVCRPFDAGRAGFVYGQGAGCLVLEREAVARRRGARVLGTLVGAATCLDGNHLPDPSVAGEVRAMRGALADAGVAPADIGYVNAHGTGSPLGDETECAALREVFGAHAGRLRVNSTKPLTGHCLQSAGMIEAIATLAQLAGRFAHANPNLAQPIDPAIGFVGAGVEPLDALFALSNSFGFGGINTSILLRREN